MKIRVVSIITGLLVLVTPISHAAEIDLSGYATFKAISNVNDQGVSYNNDLAKTGYTNFDSRESNIGIQFATDISDKLDMTVVLSARGGGAANGKYNIETEWAYASYSISNDLAVRIGKVKGPFYMVSDYKDVGYAYPWVTPPEEVYSTNPIRSVNGLDFVYQTTSGDTTYLAEVYYGGGTNTSFLLLPASTSPPGTQVDFVTHDMLGLNASIAFDGISFRAGYFNTLVDFGTLTNLEGSFGGLGMTVDVNNIVVYSEYIIRDTDKQLEQAFPDQTAYYLTTGYRIGDYLPYVTIAKLDKGKDPSEYALIQDSTALGLRIEIDDSAALKFEAASKTTGKTGVAGGASDNYGLYDAPLTSTGMIYTVAMDFLF